MQRLLDYPLLLWVKFCIWFWKSILTIWRWYRKCFCMIFKIIFPVEGDSRKWCSVLSYEPHFHLSVCVNKQNMRNWKTTNISEIHERSSHSDEKGTVGCAISVNSFAGHYAYEDDNDTSFTITWDHLFKTTLNSWTVSKLSWYECI